MGVCGVPLTVCMVCFVYIFCGLSSVWWTCKQLILSRLDKPHILLFWFFFLGLIVGPPKPTLRLQPKPRSVIASWSLPWPLVGAGAGFHLCIRGPSWLPCQHDQPPPNGTVEKCFLLGPSSTSYTISSLHPDTHYEVVVTAIDSSNRTNPSATENILTQPDGKLLVPVK